MNTNIINNYHIITSCDEYLLDQLSVLIYSISRNAQNIHTDFYVITRKIYDEKFKMLTELCLSLANITFHSIIISDAELYDKLGKYGGGIFRFVRICLMNSKTLNVCYTLMQGIL